MPKIRGVKPEYWTDDNIVELSIPARLLFIGLWNYACDNGHLQDKSNQIKMRILPADDVNCADLLREIEDQKLITRSRGWITVPNLSHHQKPHRRWWTTCDKPGCVLPEGTSHAPANRGTTVAPPKGNRGTTADSDGDSDGELKVIKDPSPKGSDTPARFDEFWDVYGKKVKRADAEKKWAKALAKVDADRIIAAAAAYVSFERANNQGGRYIADPSTWLHGERWRDERTDLPVPASNTQGHLAVVRQLAAEDAATLPAQIGDGS